MKIFFITPLLIFIWSNSVMAQVSDERIVEVVIEVRGIEVERGGNIIVMLFGKDGFPKKHDKALFTQTKMATKNLMTFRFELDMEEIAVKILHDENEDGKVTKNWTGIYPKEGLGFSNDQQVRLTGPPKYNYSKLSKEHFRHGLNISIKYP